MSAVVDCPACQGGDHSKHVGPWNIIRGLLGGASCDCRGDCKDRAQRAFEASAFSGFSYAYCSCGDRFVHEGARNIHIGRMRKTRPNETHEPAAQVGER